MECSLFILGLHICKVSQSQKSVLIRTMCFTVVNTVISLFIICLWMPNCVKWDIWSSAEEYGPKHSCSLMRDFCSQRFSHNPYWMGITDEKAIFHRKKTAFQKKKKKQQNYNISRCQHVIITQWGLFKWSQQWHMLILSFWNR